MIHPKQWKAFQVKTTPPNQLRSGEGRML